MSTVKKSSTDDDLRIALIGYGIAGANFHAPVVAAVPGCQIAAIVTRDQERAAKASSDFPKAKILDSPEPIWQKPNDYDVVIIASPNRTHVPFAELALQRGLAVVIDKPMAPTYADCQHLIKLSQTTGSLLTVFHNRRWDGDFLTVKQLIENNTLGKITRFESHFDRWRPTVNKKSWREQALPDGAGGLLFDLGSHLIDQAIFLFGQPKTVYAELHKRREESEVDDDVFLALTFAGDVNAHLWTTNLAAIRNARFRLQGTKGMYEKYGMDPQEEALKAGKTPNTLAAWGEESKASWGKFACERDGVYFEGSVRTVPGDYVEFYRQLRSSVKEGLPLPVQAEEAASVIRIIEAARKSAQEHRIVELESTVTA